MDKKNFTIETTGERIDALLPRIIPELTRSAAQKLIEKGAVLINNAPIRKNDRTQTGDILSVIMPEPENIELTAQISLLMWSMKTMI